jgi:aminoglycoside phosphotransferase (APT) family kinase protein
MPEDDWSPGARSARLLSVTEEYGLSLAGTPQLLESYSNDTWLFDDAVLRICWRGDRQRLEREAAIGTALPDEVPYPEVIAHGTIDATTWLATRRIVGETLESAWATMELQVRRSIARQLAGILSSLHSWTPSPELGSLLSTRPPNADSDPKVIAGSDLNPLPIDRALRLAVAVEQFPNIDPTLIERTVAVIEGLRAFDPIGKGHMGVAHSDLHLSNLLCDEGRIVALLDFEWVRFAPPDYDLDLLVRTVEHKSTLGVPAPEAAVLRWLRADYPDAFSHPDLLERLWLYAVTSSLREITGWPLTKPEADLSVDHPVRQLRRLVAGPEAIERVLEATFADSATL